MDLSMSDLNYAITTLAEVVKDNPAKLVPVLAYASAIILVVAILTDLGLLLRRQAQQAKRSMAETKPR